MITKRIQEKGILAKLLEQGIRILLVKECKKISNIKIDIISSSTQIIKGEIKKITIIAKDINYKDLLFDKFELEANNLKMNFKLTNKELYFINNPIIKFNISLSPNSLRIVLLSDNWNWIGQRIAKEMLNKDKLDDVKVKADQILIKASNKTKSENVEEKIIIKALNGNLYLENKDCNKSFQIPIEDKVFIKNIMIQNNVIIISAKSSVSF